MKKTLLLLATIAPATAMAQIASPDSISTHELEKVLVYSTRTAVPLKRVPGKIEVIRPEAIATSGLKDLTDLLKNKSSVDVIQYPRLPLQCRYTRIHPRLLPLEIRSRAHQWDPLGYVQLIDPLPEWGRASRGAEGSLLLDLWHECYGWRYQCHQ